MTLGRTRELACRRLVIPCESLGGRPKDALLKSFGSALPLRRCQIRVTRDLDQLMIGQLAGFAEALGGLARWCVTLIAGGRR